MSKAPSPLLGYNNNVRHKNRVFHIQTEDSGIKHPHIITHVFMDGGRILKSVKTSYAEHVEDEKVGDIVRQMMKDQHKAVFRALRDGELDAVVDEALAANRRKSQAAVAAQTSNAPPPPVSLPPEEPAPVTTREAPDDTPIAPPIELDLDALEPAATFQPEADMPPPPPNVLAARAPDPGTGRYRTLEEREEQPAPRSQRSKSERPPRTERTPTRKSDRPPSAGRHPPRSASRSDRPPRSERGAVREERVAHASSGGKSRRVDPRAEPASEPRQPVATQSSRPGPGAAVRPAALFGQARPQQSSIFGEDIISDKSLDEVILSYLAEDLEDGSK
jgi:hypothetical protein